MDWLTAPFELAFLQRALLAGLITVVTTTLVGTWVVLRGLTFLGDALAHGVLPGLALASVLGFNLGLGAAVAALVMIGGVELVHRRSRLPEDVGIGLLFVGMLALGAIIASRSPSYAGDLTTLLFGDILGVTDADLVAAAVGATCVLIATALMYRPLLALTFNPRKAAVLGMRPGLTHGVLLVLLAVAIIVSFRAVGVLLVFAFLVAPPATGAVLARRVPTMIAVALVCGTVGVVGGLLISYHAGTAGPSTMAALTVAEFFVALLVRDVLRRHPTPREAPDGAG